MRNYEGTSRDDAVNQIHSDMMRNGKATSCLATFDGKYFLADICTNSWLFGGTCQCISHQPIKFTEICKSSYELWKDMLPINNNRR